MSKVTKVLVALSGGVDSSVALALLKEQGYEVIGAFMKNWSDTKTAARECAWKAERRDALQIAAQLGIPFVTLDFEKEYREQVIEYLFLEYARGRTPNPDVLCNEKIKFPLLWREAERLGCDAIATGHHVRKVQIPDSRIQIPGWKLLVGKDPAKDQSYFLHRLTQDDLRHTLFPIGEYTKAEVRQMARERGQRTADKRSTRGICFVGKVAMPEFLRQAVREMPGPIQTTRGEVLGMHSGVAPYTLGQRHGFGVGGGTPYYVISKDPATNTLLVGDKKDPALYSTEIEVRDVHWISGKSPKLPLRSLARIRYRSPLVPVNLKAEGCNLKALFDRPIRAPAPGQFAVFYNGEECLGGGVIV